MSPEQAKPQPNTEPSESPEMIALAQRVATLRGFQRRCGAPACRRARRCVGPDVRCLREKHAKRPVPVRVIARRLAAIRRAIRNSDEGMPP